MQLFKHNPFAWILAASWVAACVVVLVYAFVQRGMGEISAAFGYMMVLLTFPAGLLVFYAVSLTGIPFVIGVGAAPFLSAGGLIAVWLALTVLGFVQWFTLLPWILARLRGDR
ncbi:MAG TPA: hypothetical protein VMP00_03180 [Burkholderiales bacterium]|nr:hypothetical protein [Burkholderiales bacterium]